MNTIDEGKKATKFVKRAVLIFLLIALIFSLFYTIPAGVRGVVLTFGKPSDLASTEGLHTKIPFVQKVIKMDVKTQKYSTPSNAASKDLQVVSTEIAVNYHLVPETVPIIYKEIGINYQDRVIQPTVQEIVKASTAKFTAEELITRRPEVKEDIERELRERLITRGINVEEVSITNFDFSVSFNEAIEAKVTAQQQKLKAQNDLERIEIEAKQKVVSAEAEADALRLQKQQVTSELIQLRQIEVQRIAIDKWNGVLPQVTGNAIPFISLGNQTI
jgi:prohibitin 2